MLQTLARPLLLALALAALAACGQAAPEPSASAPTAAGLASPTAAPAAPIAEFFLEFLGPVRMRNRRSIGFFLCAIRLDFLAHAREARGEIEGVGMFFSNMIGAGRVDQFEW